MSSTTLDQKDASPISLRSAIHSLTATDGYGPLVMRLTLALVMFPHGAQKLLGWFGGYGFSASMEAFSQGMGIPAPLAALVILAESLGAVALVFGVGTRIAAAGIGAVMIGAVTVHLPNGFFMNWFGAQAGEGFEYHLLALGLAAGLVLLGGGRFSVDRRVAALSGAQR